MGRINLRGLPTALLAGILSLLPLLSRADDLRAFKVWGPFATVQSGTQNEPGWGGVGGTGIAEQRLAQDETKEKPGPVGWGGVGGTGVSQDLAQQRMRVRGAPECDGAAPGSAQQQCTPDQDMVMSSGDSVMHSDNFVWRASHEGHRHLAQNQPQGDMWGMSGEIVHPHNAQTPSTTPDATSQVGDAAQGWLGAGSLSNDPGSAWLTQGQSVEAPDGGWPGRVPHRGARWRARPDAIAAAQAAMAPTTQVLGIISSHAESIRLAQANGETGVSAGESPTDWALWSEAFGGQTSQAQRDGVAGYNAHYNGVLIGSDRTFGDHWRAGGVLSYGNTSVADTGDSSGSSAHVNAYGLLAYASFSGAPWYVDVSAGAILQQYDTLHVIDHANDNASGEHHGMQYVANVEGGYPIKLQADATLTPIVALNYSYLSQSGYSEMAGNPDSPPGLTISATDDTSITSDLGARLERVFSTGYGDLVPSVQLAWRHQYQNTRLQTHADFAGDSSGVMAFTTEGATPITESGVLTLGITLLRNQNLTLSGQYQINAASGYAAQSVDVRLRYRF